MGKLSRGILGGFQGQTGTVYGCFWRLMDLIKAMPRKVKRPPTEAQLPGRLKLALMAGFLKWISPIVKIGFQNTPKPQSAMNAAVAYNIEHAIAGASPNFTIDMTKLVFSQGILAKPYLAEVESGVAGSVKFTWSPTPAGNINSAVDDTVTMLVYSALNNEFVASRGVVLRSAGQFVLLLPPDFSGNSVHCYVSTVSKNGKSVSASVYLGTVPVL